MVGCSEKFVTILLFGALIGATQASQTAQGINSCAFSNTLQRNTHCCQQCPECSSENLPNTCGQSTRSEEGAGEGRCCACFLCNAPGGVAGSIISRFSFVFQGGGQSELMAVKDEDVSSLIDEPEIPPPRG